MTLTGVYNKTLFRNGDNGYTIFTFKTKCENVEHLFDDSGCLVCFGNIQAYATGIPVKLEVELPIIPGENKVAVLSIEPFSDKKQLTVEYLSSDLFKGVGPATAKKIVSVTGPDIFEFFKKVDACEILMNQVPGMTEEKVNNILVIIRNSFTEKKVFDMISPFGGTFTHAKKIYDKYKINSINELKKDPYNACYSVDIPFSVADSLGQYLGFDKYSKERLSTLIYKVLQCNESYGNTYISLQSFHSFLSNVKKQLAFKEEIPMSILAPIIMQLKGVKIIKDENDILLSFHKTFRAENETVNNIKRLNNSTISCEFDESHIDKVENILNFKYSKEQRNVFNILKTSGIKILTGGPGTGKSTVINGIIALYKMMHPNNNIALCAPTGRAAQRMSEITHMNASTVHKLLDIKPYGNDFTYKDLSNPIEADLIVVDEFSMADTFLVSMLVGAIKNGSILILSGDVDQLPSVGAGNVLNDLINSHKIDTYRLTSVFRQKGDSNIVTNSIAVRNGNKALKSGKGVTIIQTKTPELALKSLNMYVEKYYDKDDVFKFQVLSTVKMDECGTVNINKIMQEKINGSNESILEIEKESFRIGDKIITTRNNYDAGYFNGDVGIIKDITASEMTVIINNEEVEIPSANIRDVSLAYAITTHKSQGSEYNTVVLILPDSHPHMLQRKLLYTGMTRAKERLIIINIGDSLSKAIENTKICQRNTLLLKLLQKA